MVASDRGERHIEPISKNKMFELYDSYAAAFFAGASCTGSAIAFGCGEKKMGVCMGVLSVLMLQRTYNRYNELRNP